MMLRFNVAIPARYGSQRLPGKPLLDIAGKPMLRLVFERALASGAEEVVIATDDERIERRARAFGARVCMTSHRHTSGTQRLSEAVTQLGWDDESLIVNLQGDEPLMPTANIRQVAEDLATHPNAHMATLCTPITSPEEHCDPNTVKVVRDRNGLALYFSRAPIPWPRDRSRAGAPPPDCYRHVGIYAYRAGYLKTYAQATPCALEEIESLEQLRALWRGEHIVVAQAVERPGRGVDTADDLAAAVEALAELSA
jgi:3-deoxy-manno-octulosonate cytidylyltransferase (CMP-KDO synthetase)